jgi:hypothetical protein
MKNKLFYFYLAFISSIISCSNETQKLKQELSIQMDTIVVKITAKEQPYYYAVDGYIDRITNHPIFIGYNHYMHSFDHFDIVDKKLVKKIELEEQGPDGVPLNGSFKFLTGDTIIYRNQDRFFIMNGQGKVVERIDLFNYIEDSEYLFRRGGITLASPANNITYKNGRLFTHILPREYFYWDDSFYAKPFLASINIDNGDIKYLKKNYPSEASSEKQFGQLLKPFTLLVDNYLIYNFSFSSKIFRLNLSTQKLDEFDVQSSFTDNTCKPLPKKINSSISQRERTTIEGDHFMSGTFFNKVVYDPYRNIYYRIHNDVPIERDGIKIIDFYLCVFDSDFKKLGEFEIDRNFYVSNYFLIKDGLILQIMNNDNIKDINKLKLCRVKFEFRI